MQEKEANEMIRCYKELSYARRATILAIQEIIYDKANPPEETIERIKSILRASGYRPMED